MERTCHVPRGMHRMARATWHKVHGLEHGLELAGRQELFGGHDRREPRAGGGQPNRSDHRQGAPDGATLHAREEHERLTYAGGGSSVTGRLGGTQPALMAPTWCPQGSLSASGRDLRGGRGWLGVAGGGRATPSPCGRPHPLATHANPGHSHVKYSLWVQVACMSPLEKFGALQRKAEDPFKPVARSSATTSAWILAALCALAR